jgi:hypothetical protein
MNQSPPLPPFPRIFCLPFFLNFSTFSQMTNSKGEKAGCLFCSHNNPFTSAFSWIGWFPPFPGADRSFGETKIIPGSEISISWSTKHLYFNCMNQHQSLAERMDFDYWDRAERPRTSFTIYAMDTDYQQQHQRYTTRGGGSGGGGGILLDDQEELDSIRNLMRSKEDNCDHLEATTIRQNNHGQRSSAGGPERTFTKLIR